MPPPPIITIFGATGFLGRAVLRTLTRSALPRGTTLRLASRNPDSSSRPAIPLPPHAHTLQCDVTSPSAVSAALRDATHVVNLVGILHETPGTSATFRTVQADAPAAMASAIASARRESLHAVRSFVHVSAIGADAESSSAYARTKAEGEQAVVALVAGGDGAGMRVTILRPSVVFGPEDAFLNRFADLARFSPFLPLVGGGATRFQPVHVDDVARAIVTSLHLEGADETAADADTSSPKETPAIPAGNAQLYELGGSTVLTFRQLMKLVLRVTGRTRMLLPLPYSVARLQGAAFETLHRAVPSIAPMLTRDQVTLLQRDNVVSGHFKTLTELGIDAAACDEATTTYLQQK